MAPLLNFNDDTHELVSSVSKVCDCQHRDTMVPSHHSYHEKRELSSERPESIGIPKIGDRLTVKTRFTKRKPKMMDVGNLSADDLHSLREEDPFMYFSIPGAFDTSRVEGSQIDLRAGQEKAPSQMVSRRSCVSTECDPFLLMDDLLDDAAEGPGHEEGEDLLEALMAMVTSSRAKVDLSKASVR